MSIWPHAEEADKFANHEKLVAINPDVAAMFEKFSTDENPVNRHLATIMQQMYLDITIMAGRLGADQSIEELTNPLVNQASVIERMRLSGDQYKNELAVLDGTSLAAHVGMK